jgi:TrpR family trp operon transcriptional repressor
MDRLEEIARTLAHLQDAELVQGFLSAILTPAEVDAVCSRWELVKRIRQGHSQRTIARDLGLSLCKITRGSRELKSENSPLERVMEIFDSMEEEKE